MGAATIEAIAAGRAALATATGDRYAVGEQLLAVVGVLAGSPALRGALADAAADRDAKAKIVDAVFRDALPGTKTVLREASASRWSSQDDLLAGIEELGIRAVASSTPAGVRSQRRSSRVRIVVAPSRFLQKAAKSCSPSRTSAALFIRSRSSGRGQASTCPRVSGSTATGVSATR